jgi:SAM-dependent methyltransferase
VLNIGCGGGESEFSPYTTVFADIEDHSAIHGAANFVQVNAQNTPFLDLEFDFVIASHVMEHVENPQQMARELARIGKRGYIEVPTPLMDNLVYYNPAGHPWWVTFDDDSQEIQVTPRLTLLKEQIQVEEMGLLQPFFAISMVTELRWEGGADGLIPVQQHNRRWRSGGAGLDLTDIRQDLVEPWRLGTRSGEAAAQVVVREVCKQGGGKEYVFGEVYREHGYYTVVTNMANDGGSSGGGGGGGGDGGSNGGGSSGGYGVGSGGTSGSSGGGGGAQLQVRVGAADSYETFNMNSHEATAVAVERFCQRRVVRTKILGESSSVESCVRVLLPKLEPWAAQQRQELLEGRERQLAAPGEV